MQQYFAFADARRLLSESDRISMSEFYSRSFF